MIEIDPRSRTPDENYKLITGLIVPRPIAWVTSLCADGTVNLAPFSAFNLVTHKPPMLMVSVGTRNGERKDTYRNILARREFVVNIANSELAEAVHASSAALAYGESEVDLLRLETLRSTSIKTPRLGRAVAAMECRLRDHISYDDADATIFIGEILQFHVPGDLLNNGKIKTSELDPLVRIGGPNYGVLGPSRSMPDPEVLITTVADAST